MIDRKKLQKNALPIQDPDIINCINQITSEVEVSNILRNQDLKDIFLNNYYSWIKRTKLNKIKGIENFKHKSFIHGTIQGFDMFYSEFSTKTFRFFKGEFIYHKLCSRNNYKYLFIEDEEIKDNDAVIISLPFADSGNEHEQMNDILNACEKRNVPVLIDLAYINLASNLEVDLNFNCIHTITVSLSKAFYSLDRLRVGMRLKREFNDDPIDVFNSIGMVNLFGIHVGNELINKYSPDFLVEKYKNKQIDICNSLKIQPSKCIIFGLGNNDFVEYNRGGSFNRVGLSSLLI